MELSLLLKAIDELTKIGEAKTTEWIHGRQIAWMKDIAKHDMSA